MLVQTHETRLRITHGGAVLPWLGPALRGILAHRLKERVCRHPSQERESRWRYCTGCPHINQCAYGRTFEPDPPPDTTTFRGQEDAARPLVVSPHFPLPDRLVTGQELPLRMTAIGAAAGESLEEVVCALSAAGASVITGIGPDHLRFEVASTAAVSGVTLDASHLPASPSTWPGVVPRLGIALTSPLFLTARDERDRRRAVEAPSFSDLLRACLRTLGSLARLYAKPLPACFSALAAAASEVRLTDHCFEPFSQRKWSSRSEQRSVLHGVVGGGVYSDVPFSLIPWLLWGGRLHVGGHRIAGAGGWRVVLD